MHAQFANCPHKPAQARTTLHTRLYIYIYIYIYFMMCSYDQASCAWIGGLGGFTWTHLDSLGGVVPIWIHLAYLDSLGPARTPLDSLSLTWTNLGSLGLTWDYLDELEFTWIHSEQAPLPKASRGAYLAKSEHIATPMNKTHRRRYRSRYAGNGQCAARFDTCGKAQQRPSRYAASWNVAK